MLTTPAIQAIKEKQKTQRERFWIEGGKVGVLRYNKNIMNRTLIVRQGRILLTDSVNFRHTLSLKMCLGTKIYKFCNFDWNHACKRWQGDQELRLNWCTPEHLELQVYYERGQGICVIGEGCFQVQSLLSEPCSELKIALTYDGVLMGWFYCTLFFEDDPKPISPNYLYIHKINIIFLELRDEEFKLQIKRNQLILFSKQFTLTQKSKIVFPNLKMPVKISDVITIKITNKRILVQKIMFLVDAVKRGATTVYQSWLRNRHHNKMGDISIEYFLQNVYLQNERQVFCRKSIIPTNLQASNSFSQTEKQKIRNSVVIEDIERVDKRIMKLNTSLNKMISEVNNQTIKNKPRRGERSRFMKDTRKFLRQINDLRCMMALPERLSQL